MITYREYYSYMSNLPSGLSAVSLRFVGEVGQFTLLRIQDNGSSAGAELDQHVAAVRADLGLASQPTADTSQLAGLAAGQAGGARPSPSRPRTTRPGTAEATCPDVPFVGSALRAEAALPLQQLLHYACGFVEAAVLADWWPNGDSDEAIDWQSMRIAAIYQLIIQAEAAAELHPDLRTLA